MARGEREGERLSLVSPSSLLCLGPALCVCFSLSLSCLSSLFVNVIQCVVSLLKNSPLSYHFWFFLLVQLFLLISACHLFPSSPFDNAIGLPFTFQLTLLCCCSSPSPSAGFYYNASIYFFPFFFFCGTTSVVSQFVSQFELVSSFPSFVRVCTVCRQRVANLWCSNRYSTINKITHCNR